MDLEKYTVLSNSEHRTYEFLSEGPRGTIKKVIFYQEIEEDVFNLAFGDWDEERQRINDKARSNNSDMDKILATVASTVFDFIEFHPGAIILAKGSTPSRTRLYQRGILKNWEAIDELFDIEGFSGGAWVSFKKTKDYEAFALKEK